MADSPAARGSDVVVQCPRLLVSVRNSIEALTALQHGADVIDVKEPAHGPLGRPSPETVASIVRVVGNKRPISIALGELIDLQVDSYEPVFRLVGLQFAKIGLAGVGGRRGWRRTWRQAWSGLPQGVRRVGVVYVDWRAAGSPDPSDAIRVFSEEGCAAILFDTFTKDGRSLVEFASRDELTAWTEAARAAAPLLVLAGSLNVDLLGAVRRYQPEILAVRGAVCQNGRSGKVSAARVRCFAAAIRRAYGPINSSERAEPGIVCNFRAD